MPHLSIQNRSKVVSLYYEYELNNKKGKYGILKTLAADLNIHVEESAIGSIMNKWFNFRTVSNMHLNSDELLNG